MTTDYGLWCVRTSIVFHRPTSADACLLRGHPRYAHKYSQRAKLLWKTSIGRRRPMHGNEIWTHNYGTHMTKKSNSCMEQSVISRTNKVCRDASGLGKLSFILGLRDSIWLRCNRTIHYDAPPDVSFLSWLSTSTLDLYNDALSVSLKRFFWTPQIRYIDLSSPKSSFLGRRVSCILITWLVHLNWYFISKVLRLLISARARTSVSGIFSCHLILRSFLIPSKWENPRSNMQVLTEITKNPTIIAW